MAYEEEEARRSRVVVNTPTSQREVVRSEAVRHPERQGISGGVLAAIVVGVVALAAIAVQHALVQSGDLPTGVAGQLGVDPAGQNGVDLDVVPRPGGGERLGQLDEGAFARGIRGGVS